MSQPIPARPSILGPTVAVLLTAAAIVIFDQLTKWLIVRLLVDQGSGRFDLIAPWLRFVYVENRGAAFGIFQGYSDILLLLAIALVIGIAITFFRMLGSSPWLPLATGLILGGAIGNIIDRVRLGFVVDFIAVGPWPKFNLADSAVFLGVVIMCGVMLFGADTRQAGHEARSDLRQARD